MRAEERIQRLKRLRKQASLTEAAKTAEKPPKGRLAMLQRLVKGGVAGARVVSDLDRILGLPLVFPMTEDEHEAFCREHLLAQAYEDGFRLKEAQSNALLQYLLYDGAFLPVGVGHGKTLISLMIAHHGHAKGRKRILLLIPPSVLQQLVKRDMRWARERVPMGMHYYVLGGMSARRRMQICQAQHPGLYIMPYSLLSQKDAEMLLLNLEPDLIISDEAHLIARSESTRTRRIAHYMSDHDDVEFCAMSGTISAKSVMDYHHLISWSLGKHSPLPLPKTEARDWGVLIDAEAQDFTGRSQVGNATHAIDPLRSWAESVTGEDLPPDIAGFRAAYRIRMGTAPGVHSTGDASVGSTLVVRNNPVEDYQKHPDWSELQGYLEKLYLEWVTPSGDEIDCAIHMFKWKYELCSGFYNNLIWPTPDELSASRDIDESEASALLERAQEHHEIQQTYRSSLRKFLLYGSHIPGVDSPMLVGQEFYRNGASRLPNNLYLEWLAVREADFEGRPERYSVPVRVCDFKIRKAVAWCQAERVGRGTGGIVWYHHQEMGRWLVDELKSEGLDVVHCPAGDLGGERILDPLNGSKCCVASIRAHGTGKNLQHFQKQFFVQWPRQAREAEQVLGRLHRLGQTADEVVANLCLTTNFDHEVFAACLNDSLYIHQTTGNRQKLVYCNYDPLPRIYSEALMAERGLDPHSLTPEALRLRHELFGDPE